MNQRVSGREGRPSGKLDPNRSVVVRLLVAALLAAGAAACQESTALPTVPSSLPADKVGVLTIACPADQTVRALNGVNARVEYSPPRVRGGQSPVTTSCTPESGTTLPIATTPAQCRATDELGQTAECRFTLTVLPAPQIAATRFLAFGDSITAGVTSSPVTTILELTKSYPYRLEEMLRQRYPVQTISVVNTGESGEKATSGVGRIPAEIDGVRPDVVLIMEGTNDAGTPRFSLANTTAALDGMVVEALARGADAMIATLPPIRPIGAQASAAAELPALNDAIRSIAFARGVPLVDIFGALAQAVCPTVVPVLGVDLGGERLPFATAFPCIGSDNIHPTAEGYEVIATEFFNRIVERYDATASGATVRADARMMGSVR